MTVERILATDAEVKALRVKVFQQQAALKQALTALQNAIQYGWRAELVINAIDAIQEVREDYANQNHAD